MTVDYLRMIAVILIYLITQFSEDFIFAGASQYSN